METHVTFPTDLASFLELIRQHGDAAYTIVFSLAVSHSMLFSLFAGYAASAGALSYTTLVVVCWLGSFLGDVVRFWIGRRFGHALVKRFQWLQRPTDTVVRLAEHNHVWMILMHRYPHGLRGIAAIAYGMTALGWSRFLVLSFVAAGIWAVLVVSAGYAFGALSEKAMNGAANGIGIAALVIFLALSWYMNRRFEALARRG